ncbi:hypothetical protein NSB25_04140 [Acetatifactor muris]|uniref:Heparinase II/III-like protein n=1 Tax=Acetatifactor muris TaxID=879566 RepID=A0A2K4ZBX3_9FIRM|nr:hypothetical protein [Acetatifactor muris]MCI8799125.1 hypothetical protein [Lachnospiraceae bacterium]MCR2046466.1 hypothetical protein [Acetatifactor muris]SOY27965.1 hypothetical protein AMURIS_00670 [Acetatifactor muris]
MLNTYFNQKLVPGKPIRPFMVAGVLEKDYRGERTGQAMRACVEEALVQAQEDFAQKAFREFDSFTLCGMEGKWTVCDAQSPRYADGHYYIMEKLALMPIYLELESECDQEITVRIQECRLIMLLNGSTVYNNTDIHARKRPRRYVFEHVVNPNCEMVTLKLRAGRNTLIAVTGKVDRGTGISFSMELVFCSAAVSAGVPLNMAEEVRGEIFRSQLETHLEDDSYVLGETPKVHVGGYPLSHCLVELQVSSAQEKDLFSAVIGIGDNEENGADREGNVALEGVGETGEYSVHMAWKLPDGTLLTEKTLSFSLMQTMEPFPGWEHFEERRQQTLERLAERGNALGLYRLGRAGEIDQDKIKAMCHKIETRADCADFDLLPLLWLMWEDRGAGLLDREIVQMVKEAALGFRYWVDEPGTSSMFYCSENHRIGFHVCEYLAGLLYPEDIFTNCGQNGMYHSLKGRMHLVEWLNQRCRAGFDEPHSDSYLPVTLSALLVLREVLPMEEYPLRNMVNVLLDFMTFIFAVSNFDGVMATPRGRSYNKPLRSRLSSGINGLFWLYFGNAPANVDFAHQEMAFSYYVPPRALCELADNFTPATFTFKEGIMHFDKHNADFTIRRTPEYMIGGVRDHNVGMCDMHFISAMIVLPGDISLFFSSPNNVAEGSGLRPDYWAGQAFLPRVLMHGRTLAVIWHNVNNPDIWMTHCHFNARKFDEVVSEAGWTFGRKGESYVGIYSSAPHSFRREGSYAGRELVCDGNETVWLAECGSRREDGSFEDFRKKMLGARIAQEGEQFLFVSPGSGRLEFGLTEGFLADGQPVEIPDDLVSCPYLHSRYGSGRFNYTCPGFTVTQWTYPASE